MINRNLYISLIIIFIILFWAIILYRLFSGGEMYYRNLLYFLAIGLGTMGSAMLDLGFVQEGENKQFWRYLASFSFWKMVIMAIFVVTIAFGNTTTLNING